MSLDHISLSELCPSFQPHEIFSPDLMSHGIFHLADVDFLLKLQRFRDQIWSIKKVGLIVNHGDSQLRGFRSTNEQILVAKKYGGAEITSMHCAGKACDLTMSKNHDSEWLAARALDFGFTGVGQYPTFVHVDVRSLFERTEAVRWIKG